jgi:hypothetical protein
MIVLLGKVLYRITAPFGSRIGESEANLVPSIPNSSYTAALWCMRGMAVLC